MVITTIQGPKVTELVVQLFNYCKLSAMSAKKKKKKEKKKGTNKTYWEEYITLVVLVSSCGLSKVCYQQIPAVQWNRTNFGQ